MGMLEADQGSDLLDFWVGGDPPRASGCDAGHEWVVYSTALAERWLMIQCVECGLMGTIEEPSVEEWTEAYHAPSRPYRWLEQARVVQKAKAPLCVIRSIDGSGCLCPRQRTLPVNKGYERVPGGIWQHTDIFSQEVKAELIDFAEFVGESELCSRLLPLFVRSVEADTGLRHSQALHLIVNRIESFDDVGIHCSPGVLGKIIREFAEYQAS